MAARTRKQPQNGARNTARVTGHDGFANLSARFLFYLIAIAHRFLPLYVTSAPGAARNRLTLVGYIAGSGSTADLQAESHLIGRCGGSEYGPMQLGLVTAESRCHGTVTPCFEHRSDKTQDTKKRRSFSICREFTCGPAICQHLLLCLQFFFLSGVINFYLMFYNYLQHHPQVDISVALHRSFPRSSNQTCHRLEVMLKRQGGVPRKAALAIITNVHITTFK